MTKIQSLLHFRTLVFLFISWSRYVFAFDFTIPCTNGYFFSRPLSGDSFRVCSTCFSSNFLAPSPFFTFIFGKTFFSQGLKLTNSLKVCDKDLDDKVAVEEDDDVDLKKAKEISLVPFATSENTKKMIGDGLKNTNSLKVYDNDLDVKEVVGDGEARDLDSFVSWADSDPEIKHLFSVLGIYGIDVEGLEMGKKDRMLVLSDIKEQSKVLGLEDVPVTALCTTELEFQKLVLEILLMNDSKYLDEFMEEIRDYEQSLDEL